uniref:Uncharacterized protein n=1 Tax=Fagus sylvatica TaxID=28930 RepID=A0A2N9ISS0_FAGSY
MMKSDRSCWVGFAAGVGLGLGVGCWVGFAAGVGWVWAWVAGLGLPPAWVWVWPWVAGLGLPPAWVGFGRGWVVPEGMGTGSAGGDGYG